jgi:ATP-dependent Clp protease ATP-binding subunit ClpB
VLFKALTEPEIEQVFELMLEDLRSPLAPRRISLEVTESGSSLRRRAGVRSGVRRPSTARFIAHEVETRIGRALLANDVLDGAVIRVPAKEAA